MLLLATPRPGTQQGFLQHGIVLMSLSFEVLLSPEFSQNPEKWPRLTGLAFFSLPRAVKSFLQPSTRAHTHNFSLKSSSDSVLSSKLKQLIAFEVRHIKLPELVIPSLRALQAQPENNVTSADSDDEAVSQNIKLIWIIAKQQKIAAKIKNKIHEMTTNQLGAYSGEMNLPPHHLDLQQTMAKHVPTTSRA